jgi:hypothetical protein
MGFISLASIATHLCEIGDWFMNLPCDCVFENSPDHSGLS